MKELAMSGGNTIICWDTTKLETTLNQARLYNLSVIIGIDIPGVQFVDAYKNEEKVAALYAACNRIVLKYKDHPATFAWCLGNELTFPFSPDYDLFYTAYNRMLVMIHEKDPNHPVCTTVINAPKRAFLALQWRIPSLDFIGINTYNSLKKLKKEIAMVKLFWNGAYFVSEWAPKGGWESSVTSWQAPLEENSSQKAQEYYDFFTKYMPVKDPQFLGSVAFYWGSRYEYTHTWYSIFDENGAPTEIKEALNDCWKDTITQHNSPQITDILIDGNLVAKDNIIINAGSRHKAEIILKTGKLADTLQYAWQIVKDDWSLWAKPWANFKKPAAEIGLLSNSTTQHTAFTAALKEGPYRIFVVVYNSKGYCALANTPFYVIE